MANRTAISPSANRHKLAGLVETVLIAVANSRRTHLFQQSLAQMGQPQARVITFRDLLSGKALIADCIKPPAILRIDSPGKDFETERGLLHAGAETEDDRDYAGISSEEVNRLEFERGRILYPRQWYLGFCRALELIRAQLASSSECSLMNNLSDTALMFDKPRCQAALNEQGIPTPANLGEINSFAELRERMRESGCDRVFIKLAHGSSASGVVAYQTNGDKHQATTTVEIVARGKDVRLYNSRRIRVCREVCEIALLVDTLCRHRVYVEQWLPKAGMGDRTFDLRVVVIARRAMHTVVRLSRHPMTNLHLLGGRGDLDQVLERMGERAWTAARSTCEQLMSECFPKSLYAGIDLRISPDYRRHTVLEVNAFGDLLPDVLCDGLDTYATELSAVLGGGHVQVAVSQSSPTTNRI